MNVPIVPALSEKTNPITQTLRRYRAIATAPRATANASLFQINFSRNSESIRTCNDHLTNQVQCRNYLRHNSAITPYSIMKSNGSKISVAFETDKFLDDDSWRAENPI